MKSAVTYLFISLLCASAEISANAQSLLNVSLVPSPYSNLKTLAGYQPSVLASTQDAQKVYQSMQVNNFKPASGCYQRAHIWAYDLYQSSSIRSMKVMLFFTARYQREFDYVWFYHIAPLIPVRLDDGTIEEQVFDPTFTSPPVWMRGPDVKRYDNKPLSIQQWTRYFVLPNVECPLVENYDEVRNPKNADQYYCYTMKVPMFNYLPENQVDDISGKSMSFDLKKGTPASWYNPETKTRTGWRSFDLIEMKKGLKKE